MVVFSETKKRHNGKLNLRDFQLTVRKNIRDIYRGINDFKKF